MVVSTLWDWSRGGADAAAGRELWLKRADSDVGGSSTIAFLALMGLVENVHMRRYT